MRRIAAITTIVLMSACATTGGQGPSNAPPPVDGTRRSADGLEVGHRLMAAEEYELALKAYYLAASQQGFYC